MRTYYLEISQKNPTLKFKLTQPLAAIQLALTDGIEIVDYKEIQSDNEFPPRYLTEQTIIKILKDNGGSIKIRDIESGWNIYDEVAARLGVSAQTRKRLTRSGAEPAWRPEVGFARKNLERAGILKPTEESGRGIWSLK